MKRIDVVLALVVALGARPVVAQSSYLSSFSAKVSYSYGLPSTE